MNTSKLQFTYSKSGQICLHTKEPNTLSGLDRRILTFNRKKNEINKLLQKGKIPLKPIIFLSKILP